MIAGWTGRVRVETLGDRDYRTYEPAHRAARTSLVLDLHGTHENGFLEESFTRFDRQADRLGWVVAYPDGVDGGWEPFGCCHRAGVDDVAFISALIDHFRATDGIDAVYVMGSSRGAMMAYRLACELSSRITAVAAVEGNMADANANVDGVQCPLAHSVSVLAIHGTADSAVPIKGGGRFAPFVDVVGKWRRLDGCAPAGVVRAGGTDMTWSCSAGTQVRSIVVPGGGHSWPGAPLANLPWTAAGSLDASRIIADFFAAR
ncbi:alpha/beta hydrolase family esterase [Fodinicola feengrottensis]|uniref:alpha/beta hydrolase family esterase n=1 Tax=Fodinicola feengrottensis TaxID=435914 RepID=UPI0013D888BB|nr:PHB depolymerase family esterase [Fodinicola feengrottensis]